MSTATRYCLQCRCDCGILEHFEGWCPVCEAWDCPFPEHEMFKTEWPEDWTYETLPAGAD